MAKVCRDVRLHYGGKFVENSMIKGIELYEWAGGTFVDVRKVTLELQTLEGLINLFKLHCPLNTDMNLRFYYMVGGNRFELDKDMEVEFAWSISFSTSEIDYISNIYCESDIVIPSPSLTISQSTTMSISVTHLEQDINVDEAPLINTTQEHDSQPEVEVSSPLKMTSRRSGRLSRVYDPNVGSPAHNTRGARLRKTPTKKSIVKKNKTMKNKKVRMKLSIEENNDPLPKIKVPFGEPCTITSSEPSHQPVLQQVISNNEEPTLQNDVTNNILDLTGFSVDEIINVLENMHKQPEEEIVTQKETSVDHHLADQGAFNGEDVLLFQGNQYENDMQQLADEELSAQGTTAHQSFENYDAGNEDQMEGSANLGEYPGFDNLKGGNEVN